MRIGILDVGGNFFGPSFGMSRLGHEVHYCPVGAADYLEELARHLFTVTSEPQLDTELFVYAASFADESWGRAAEIVPDAVVDPARPLQPSLHPEQARIRQQWLTPRLRAHPHVALVDMSDNEYFRDAWFESHGTWRFRRELVAWRDGNGVLPFPWLYQPALLWTEIVHGIESVLLPMAERQSLSELVFAGTVDHWRYRGARERAIVEHLRRHPDVPLHVEQRLPLTELWPLLQRARGGLYLHGHGQLCFRLHELTALGVPAYAPEAFSIRVPDAWQDVLSHDPHALRSPAQMLRFYVEHYHPVHAARYVLEHCLTASCV